MEPHALIVRAKGGQFVTVIAEADNEGGVNILVCCYGPDSATPLFATLTAIDFNGDDDKPTMTLTPLTR